MIKKFLFFTFLLLPNFALSQPQKLDASFPFEVYKFEGSSLEIKRVQKFAEANLGWNLKARGQVVQLTYRAPSGNAPLEVIENYKQAFSQQGFSVVKDEASGHLGESTGDGRALLLKRVEAESGESFLHVNSFTVRSSWRPQDKINYFTNEMKLNPQDVIINVQIVSPKVVEQKMVKENVSYILEQLEKSGRVQLYGIFFDTDKTEIKKESEPVLTEVAKALNNEQNLKLKVVGHTDKIGDNDHNMRLSLGRAQSVVMYLVNQGIKAERLSPEGMGATSPIDSNDTEQGRAKNRRVELVKYS